MNAEIAEKLDEIRELSERHGIARLKLFGSATRDDFDVETSDFDFLVEFLEDGPNTGFASRFFSFKSELDQLFVRPVDLGSAGSPILDQEFRESIYSDKALLYAAQTVQIASKSPF